MPAARLPRWANRYPPRGFAPRSARRYTKPRGSPLLTTGTTSAVTLRGVNFARRLGVNTESRLTVKHLVLCRVEKRPPKLDLDVYPYLPKATVGRTSAASYMCLLSEDAA